VKNYFSQQASTHSDLLYMHNIQTFLSSVFKTLAVPVVIVICSYAETLSKFLIASFSTPGMLEYPILELRSGQQYRT